MTKYNITEKKDKEANYRTLVSPQLMDELKEKILDVIVMQKKYKDCNYSAKRLAEDLQTNTRYISAVMNVRFHTNYTSFVNKYRIEEAMSILVDKRYQDLSIEDAFINPKTHEMFLLDNWHNIIPAGREKKYLKGMRELIKGIHCTSAPPKLYEEFLNSEPASNAYEDFERWDNVIMNGFSGHNFHKFDLLDI